MAATKVKTTYSLDPETIATLNNLARRWDVPRSEALRRVINIAASVEVDDRKTERLAALQRLQSELRLTKEDADAWVEEVREIRHASSEKRMSRW